MQFDLFIMQNSYEGGFEGGREATSTSISIFDSCDMKTLWSEFGHLHWLQNANTLKLECPFFQPFYRQGRHKIWKFWFLALCVAYPVLMWLAWFRRGRPAGIACLQIWIDFYECTDTDKKIAFKTWFFFSRPFKQYVHCVETVADSPKSRQTGWELRPPQVKFNDLLQLKMKPLKSQLS